MTPLLAAMGGGLAAIFGTWAVAPPLARQLRRLAAKLRVQLRRNRPPARPRRPETAGEQWQKLKGQARERRDARERSAPQTRQRESALAQLVRDYYDAADQALADRLPPWAVMPGKVVMNQVSTTAIADVLSII